VNFDVIRPMFGGSLTQEQVDGINAVLSAWEDHGDGDNRKLAYALATAHHETGRRFTAVIENLNYTSAARIRAVWPSRFKTEATAAPFVRQPQKLANKVYAGRLGNDGPDDGWLYRGRGLAQITGKDLYRRLSKLVGIDLVANPDAALEVGVAAKILVVGLMQGLFTGKKLADYITPAKADFKGARATVNADGKANGQKIADYAVTYLNALATASPAVPAPKPPPAAETTAPKPTPIPTSTLPPADPGKTKPHGWAAIGAVLLSLLYGLLKAFGLAP
jgi:putative chitinase